MKIIRKERFSVQIELEKSEAIFLVPLFSNMLEVYKLRTQGVSIDETQVCMIEMHAEIIEELKSLLEWEQ